MCQKFPYEKIRQKKIVQNSLQVRPKSVKKLRKRYKKVSNHEMKLQRIRGKVKGKRVSL